LAGGFVALSDGLAVNRGAFGVAPAAGHPAALAAGTAFSARFLVATAAVGYQEKPEHKRAFDADPAAWLRAMGLGGETPYELRLTRGTLDGVAFTVDVTPEGHGVAGAVVRAAAVPYQPPFRISGLNDRWAAGIWRENGELTFAGIFEGTAWPRLDVSVPGRFFAGNLLTSDNPELVLEFVIWSADAVKVEVHNPTKNPITATVATAAEIDDHRQLKKTLTVAAGSTVYCGL
jgi:hypothetical protein